MINIIVSIIIFIIVEFIFIMLNISETANAEIIICITTSMKYFIVDVLFLLLNTIFEFIIKLYIEDIILAIIVDITILVIISEFVSGSSFTSKVNISISSTNELNADIMYFMNSLYIIIESFIGLK